ncbi:hypothetical protein VTH82DRAFT_2359, partial [Thermothelomyces myriococcoides]
MSSINDLATAASALVNNPTTAAATAPHPTLPDSAPTQQAQADDDRGTSEHGRPGEPASSSSVARGALVVLEGLDRSGKTTQVKLLEQRFVELGRKVKVMRFPDRTTPIGRMIDSYLKSQVEMEDHVIHLLFSANRWEAA